MNRSTLSSSNKKFTLSISKAIDGFLKFKVAEGLSQRTVDSYEYYLNQWMNHIGDQDVAKIKSSDLTNYLAWMRTEYKPKRWNGNEDPLSAKSLRNVYIALRAFYTWLNKEFNLPNPAKEITPPKFPQHVIQTFSKEDIEKLIKACVYSREAQTEGRHKFVMRRPSANRDQAIVLTLLDTGLRATELCSLTVEDVDLKTGKVNVRHGVGGGAKGGKGRVTYLGKVARKAVWRYLATREDGSDPKAPVFISAGDRPFNRDSLRILIRRLGERVQIAHVHPHKFRHTFAITYLRSGGDVFTLQSLLGHGSLDMVRHYAQIAEVDVENAHRKASPVDNWRL
jgi:integrase/recombinase XerD